MRRTAYCAELFEDASLVGLYGSACSPTVQYGSRLPSAFIPSVCRYSAASRLGLVRAAASRETREKGPARVLLILVDLGCLLQCADWRRRSIVTILGHGAVLR
jgi:hypothetical protein